MQQDLRNNEFTYHGSDGFRNIERGPKSATEWLLIIWSEMNQNLYADDMLVLSLSAAL